MTIAEDWKWLTQHLLLLGLVAGLAWGGVYAVEGIISKHDQANAQRMDQVAQQSAAQNALIQKQTSDAIAQLASQNQVLSAQVQGLMQVINSRDQALLQLQTQVKSMQAPALAAEWPKYIKEGSITAVDNGVQLDLPAARDTLSQLEALPVALADKQSLLEANQKQSDELGNTQQALGDSQAALKSEQLSHAADNKACVADKAAIKSAARRKQTKIAAIFTVIGIVAARALGI
jgi:hypothetical protein